MIQDLDSTNGTFLDGSRVTVPTPDPARSAPIKVGATTLRAAAVAHGARRPRRAPPSRTSGKIRSNNQDSGYAGRNLFVVADGMGGHAGGDVGERHRDPAHRRGRRRLRLRTGCRGRPAGRPDRRQPPARRDRARALRAHRHGHDGERAACVDGDAWSSRTSATRASTCSATARSARSPPTTRSCSASSTPAASPPRRRGAPAPLGAHARARRRGRRPRDRHVHRARHPARRPLAAVLRRPLGRRVDRRATRADASARRRRQAGRRPPREGRRSTAARPTTSRS